MPKNLKPEWLLFAEKLVAEFETYSRSGVDRYRTQVYNLHWKAESEFKYRGTEDDWRTLIDRLYFKWKRGRK